MKIVDRFRPWAVKIKDLLQNKWIRLVIQVSILTLCGIYLVRNFQNIIAIQLKFQVNIYLLVLVTIITICSVFLGALGFYFTLKAMRISIHWREVINIHLQSNLAKYIPGYAWQLIGKAYLTKQAGISTKLVGASMTVELLQLVLAGLCVGIITLPESLLTRLGVVNSAINLLPIFRVLCGVILFTFPLVIYWGLVKGRIVHQSRDLDLIYFYAASLVLTLSWIVFGYSFWLSGKAIFSVPFSQLQLFMFTLTASFIIGLAIIIVPASIGVRESIMVWLLGPVVGGPQAVIIAGVARIVVTISELVSAYAFGLIRRGKNNPKVLGSKVKN